jgi:hypothetical protein
MMLDSKEKFEKVIRAKFIIDIKDGNSKEIAAWSFSLVKETNKELFLLINSKNNNFGNFFEQFVDVVFVQILLSDID